MLPTRRPLALAAAVLLVSCTSDESPLTAPSRTAPRAAHHNSSLAPGDVRTILGPVSIVRDKATPATSSFVLSGYSPAATLHILNGDANGKNRTTSATVTVDGVEVAHEPEFGNKVATIDKPITLRNSSTIEVRQSGAPGSTIVLSVDGSLATTAAVPPTGASVHLLGDQVTLAVPPGALSSPITATAEPVPPPTTDAIPGTSIDFGPSGTVFSAPVTISIAFDPTVLPAGVKPAFLAMFFWNVDHWDRVAGSTVDVAHGIVSGQTTHFSTYALLPNAIEFCPGDATAEQDLQTGITRVPANGTLYVCDGTFDANQITIDKPMTITAEHAGLATLRQTAGAVSADRILRVSSVPSGTITITNMSFDFQFGAFSARGGYDTLTVLNSKFRGRSLTQGTGLEFFESAAVAPKITIDHNEFTNSAAGVGHRQPVDIDVFHNNFHDLGTFDLITQTSNGQQNPVPTGYTARMRTARIQWNTFHNCGANICIADEQAGMDTIRFNTITMDSGSVVDAIFIFRAGQPASLSAPVVVSDNTISGHGPAATADSATGASWGMFGAIVQHPSTVVVPTIVERNVIDGAFLGLAARAGGANQMVATDNRIVHAYVAVSAASGDNIIAHRNDFSSYRYPITSIVIGATTTPLVTPQPTVVPPSRLACNYWGSSTGPVGVLPAIPVGAYTPYSTVPIANQAAVSCDPGVPPTTVRYCATQGGTVPTITTSLSDAVAVVPNGGTVLICDGTYTFNNLTIQKPVTITAEGPGMPTIDGDGNVRALVVTNISSGSVTISHLRFTGGTSQNLLVTNNVSAVSITDNEFHPGLTNPVGVAPRGSRSGLLVNGTGIGSVTVANNAFIGGDVGMNVNGVGGATVSIHDNSFTGMANAPITMASQATIAGSITIDHNDFSDCSDNVCMLIGQPATITNNTLTARMARQVINFIQIATGTSASTAATVVSGNTLLGLDQTGARNVTNNYPVKSGAIFAFSGAVVATGNTISTVANGLSITSPAGMTATDNIITTTFAPIIGTSSSATGVLTANWNRFSDYVAPISQPTFLNLSALNARCNWWGSATGPIGMSGLVPSGAYTPFLTAVPTGHTGCVP